MRGKNHIIFISCELVPTEAELARREGRDYEPASVLLERIKVQRAMHEQNGTKENKKIRRVSGRRVLKEKKKRAK